MSDLKLFNLSGGSVSELEGGAVALERSLQSLFERNLETLLGVRFLATEFSTSNGGRIDSLGIDENNCPVIIEYKRDRNENVINQGLFYLDWLMDHRRDFEWLVLDKYGKDLAKNVEWSAPRLICIAGDFTKFDGHAVNQMNRNIELIRYRRFEGDLLLLELLTAASSNNAAEEAKPARISSRSKTVTEYLAAADVALVDLYEALKVHLLALGDDVQIKTVNNYIAFRRIKNFACVEVHPRTQKILVYAKVNPDTVDLEAGFTRDVRKIGHFGTGDLEIVISDLDDLERAKPLLAKSYEVS